jgi:hypothetical protein
MSGAWKGLLKHYPDNFEGSGGKASLELLGNVEPLREKINMVRARKDKIIADKSADYCAQQKVKNEKYKSGLLEIIDERITKLSASDLQAIEQQKKKLEDTIQTGSELIDEKLRECLDGTKNRLKKSLAECTRHLSADTGRGIDAEEEVDTRDVTNRKKSESFGSGIARFFGGIFKTDWGWEVSVETITTRSFRAGAAKMKIAEGLEQFNANIEETVSNELANIKKELPAQIKKIFGETVEEGILDPAFLNRAINNMVQTYTGDMDWDFEPELFEYPASGTISDDGEIANFRSAWDAYKNKINKSYSEAILQLFHAMEENKANHEPSSFVFSDLKAQIETLAKDFENKKSTLERLGNIKIELQRVN